MWKPVLRFHKWCLFSSNNMRFWFDCNKRFPIAETPISNFWCYNSCTSRSSQVKVRKCCNISQIKEINTNRIKVLTLLRELIFEGVLFDQCLNIADSVLLVYLKRKYLEKSHKILPSTLTCCSLSKKKTVKIRAFVDLFN